MGSNCWRNCVTASEADGCQLFLSHCPWSPEWWQSLEQSCLDSHWWQQEWFWSLYFIFLSSWIDCPWSFSRGSSKVSVSLRWSLVSWSIFRPIINFLMMPLEIPGCDSSFLKVWFWSWRIVFRGDMIPFRLAFSFAPKALNLISLQLCTSSVSLGSLTMTLFTTPNSAHTLWGPGVESLYDLGISKKCFSWETGLLYSAIDNINCIMFTFGVGV